MQWPNRRAELRWKVYAKPLNIYRKMLVSRSQFRQKSMKNRCRSWWLKRDRQNHEKVMIFPNDLRPLLGPKSEKTTKKNEYGRFGAPWGSPWALKCRSGEGLKKYLHFCHELDQILSRFGVKLSWFVTCLFGFLNRPPNQHNMYNRKRFSEKATCAETTWLT